MVNSSKVSDKETSSDAGSIQKDPQIAKEARKNDKKAPLAPIHQFYHEALSDYPVLLRNTKTKGRHAVASRALDEGTTVCLEQAAAFIVRSPYLDEHCHVCLDTLTTKLMCSDCKKSFYCSQKCLEKDDTHSIVCSAFSQVDAIGRATDVEPDMLRLIALLLARRQRDNEKNKSEDPKDDVSSLKKNPTPYWCVEELISHRDRSDPAFIKVMTEAAQRLLSELPESAQIPADDVATLACRINSNAHGLGDNDCRNTDVALGLFPLGAMFFNHACNPNCVFVGMKGDQLAFRTIRPVQQDEELTVSYIDVYASRDERRQDLLYTKHFWCRCKRCSAPMKASVDRYLQSIVCENCCNDVYVIPPSPMEKLIQGESNETKAPEQEEWKCASCGHAASARHVAEALRHAKELYQEGIAAIQRERDYQRAKSKLEPLAKVDTSKKQSLAGALHPQNAVRFNATIPLMNSFRRSQDIKSAIDMNRLVLERFEEYAKLSLPKNTPEISDFYQNLGELCDLMAEKCKASGRGPLERKWQKEARAAFANAAKVRSVVYGADHPKTRFAKKYVSHAYVRR